jgi:hypothetical protein
MQFAGAVLQGPHPLVSQITGLGRSVKSANSGWELARNYDAPMALRQVTGRRDRYRRFGLPTVGWVLVGAGILAACGSTPAAIGGSNNGSTPLALAQSWFKSINSKDVSAAQGDFVPSARSMMDWGGGDAGTWSTFTKLRCKTLQQSGRNATVYCSFNESPSPSEGNPDSFWTISMQRSDSGHWLINNYGQG